MHGPSRGSLLLNPDFRDILSNFCEEKVEFLGRLHLIRNKKAVGRPQDLADIARLEEE
jgi:hypothetical protein